MTYKIIKEVGNSALLELVDTKERYILPKGETDILMGIPVGLPWQEITNQKVADFLRSKDIYTYEQLQSNPNLAQEILYLGQDYYQLLSLAKNFGGNE